MNGGDTFTYVDTSVDQHLWFIVSDPLLDDKKVVVVDLTTVGRFKETTCLINRGEHPFVKHQTCVAYKYAKIVTLEWLTEKFNDGKI